MHWGYYKSLAGDATAPDTEDNKVSYCNAVEDNTTGGRSVERWRVPTIGELLGLLVDDEGAYELHEDTPAITGLRPGLTIPLAAV